MTKMQISPLGALGSLRSFRKNVTQPTRFCKNMFKSYVQNITFPNINLAKLHSQMNTTLAICYLLLFVIGQQHQGQYNFCAKKLIAIHLLKIDCINQVNMHQNTRLINGNRP